MSALAALPTLVVAVFTSLSTCSYLPWLTQSKANSPDMPHIGFFN